MRARLDESQVKYVLVLEPLVCQCHLQIVTLLLSFLLCSLWLRGLQGLLRDPFLKYVNKYRRNYASMLDYI